MWRDSVERVGYIIISRKGTTLKQALLLQRRYVQNSVESMIYQASE